MTSGLDNYNIQLKKNGEGGCKVCGTYIWLLVV